MIEEEPMRKIEAPTQCPVCGSDLEWSKHILYCLNPVCQGQVGKQVEHFAKSLKIKGLGPKTIDKLNLSTFADIYSLTEEYIATMLSSEVLAQKLIKEIENSKKATLEQLLPAFSIKLIGKTAAEKLSFVCKDISEINEDTCKAAGLGPKATEYLMDWLEERFPAISGLPFTFEFTKRRIIKDVKGTVCISGKLTSVKTKAQAAKVLEEAGYKVSSSMTKNVTILLNESGIESSKTKKARESGITVIDSLYELIGENI